jgi:hypothetical protein
MPMNHPDINRDALHELIDDITDIWSTKPPDQTTWRAALLDIVRWARITKHDAIVEYSDAELTLRFPTPLPLSLNVRTRNTDDEDQLYTVRPGSDRLGIAYKYRDSSGQRQG